jgi:hypothetical protein
MVSAFVHDPAFMHERRAKGGRVDYAGIALLALSLGLLQIVLDRGQRADWFNTPWVVYAASFSALSFVLLVLRELLFSEPILDLQVFKQTAFLVATRLVEHFSGLRGVAPANNRSAFAWISRVSIFAMASGHSSTTRGHLWAHSSAIRNARVQRYLLDYRDRDHSINSALLLAAQFETWRYR